MPILHGKCHCGAVRYTITLEDEKRIEAEYCHCDDCRLTIGFFCGLFGLAPAHMLKVDPASESALVRYNASAAFSRVHCGTCGTTLGCALGEEAAFPSLATLVLPEGTTLSTFVDIKGHIFADSPPEGGISCIMDDGFARYAQRDKPWTLPATGSDLEQRILDVERGAEIWGDELKGSCHCKGIQFAIQRPPADYAEDPQLKNFVKVGRRFAAIHCMCDTCRTVSGAPFWTGTFVPTKLITFTSNSTERIYNSSPQVNRRFCGRCGCTYGYTVSGAMWGLAVGPLEQPRAEGWLSYEPTSGGADPADKIFNMFMNGPWVDESRVGRPLSHVKDAERYNPELLDAVKRGRAKCGRF
ncbi:hypothetical protein AURDEDRAFT_167553 [Auricularia subglabra TFB-10046 SS5]|nr:hypothetical protein AURDEDRAFT_167553 [Auricularia subglabra TFB-10046 SS5]